MQAHLGKTISDFALLNGPALAVTGKASLTPVAASMGSPGAIAGQRASVAAIAPRLLIGHRNWLGRSPIIRD